MTHRFATLAVVTLLTLAVARADEKADESKPLDGDWVPAAAELAGKKFPDEVLKTMKLTMAGENYTVRVGEGVDKGTVRTDAKATPRRLTITGTEGPNKGKTMLAIYERKGDALKICYDLDGKTFPAAFESRPGTKLFLVTYRRGK